MRTDKQTLIQRQLASIKKLSLQELKDKFEELYGFPAKGNNAETFRRRIAYRLQEFHFGSLSQEAQDYLDKLADNDPMARLEVQPKRRSLNIPGTRLIKEWQGNTYEVVVQGKRAFEYDGKKFKSLSAIAREITGTNWNGRRFFGLTK